MKKIIVICITMVLVAGLAWAKVDFSKPAPVRIFEPLDTVGIHATTKGNSNKRGSTSVAGVPVNVLPISMEIDEVKNGKTGHKSNICSAMRLTSTLVLTAAHCVEDFSHGQRIYAEPFTTADQRWGLYLLNNKNRQYTKFNATVFFYRPGYSADGSAMSHAFDFALVKLDSHLVLNTAFVKQEINKALADIPDVLQQVQGDELLTQTIYQEVHKAFEDMQRNYKKFITSSLEKFDLLQMTPDVVPEEMKNRTVRAYFWPVNEKTGKRGPVKVFSGSVLGTDGNNHGNTHTLLWNIRTVRGTSGSPVLDVQRRLVVSVSSGPIRSETEGGGLISAEVCQWVKSHDASVKCLAVEGGAKYEETGKTAAWGH